MRGAELDPTRSAEEERGMRNSTRGGVRKRNAGAGQAWYDTLRIELGALADERQATLIQIRRLLLTMLRNARSDDALAAMSHATRRTPADES